MINILEKLKPKLNIKIVFLALILIVILSGGVIWIDQQAKKEFLETGLPRRSVPEFIVDRAVSLFSEVFTGKESTKIKKIEAKKEEVQKLKGKEEPLTKRATAIKEELIKKAISENRGDFLLQKTENYKIEYIKSPDVFIVTIGKEPVETYRKEVQNWLLSQGFSQDGICNLGVHFVLEHPLRLKLNITNFDQRPFGCE